MQIVFDIDEETYKNIIATWGQIHPKIHSALKNGMILPKWHGRLIDADKLKQKIEMADDNIMKEDWNTLYDNVISDIDNAYAIIEADRSEEE